MFLNSKKIVAVTTLLLLSFCTTVPLLGSYERDYGEDDDYTLPKKIPRRAKKPKNRTFHSGNCSYCSKYRKYISAHQLYCQKNPDRRTRPTRTQRKRPRPAPAISQSSNSVDDLPRLQPPRKRRKRIQRQSSTRHTTPILPGPIAPRTLLAHQQVRSIRPEVPPPLTEKQPLQDEGLRSAAASDAAASSVADDYSFIHPCITLTGEMIDLGRPSPRPTRLLIRTQPEASSAHREPFNHTLPTYYNLFELFKCSENYEATIRRIRRLGLDGQRNQPPFGW